MELVERLPLERIHYLDSLTYQQVAPLYPRCKNEKERQIKFRIMKEFCRTNIRTRGETKRIYSYTLTTPLEVGGRLYCGNSIQGLPCALRGFLMGGISTDIDMANCHPRILSYLCDQFEIACPQLKYYLENRATVLAEHGEGAKQEFLKCVNDSKRRKAYKTHFYQAFDRECKAVQKQLCATTEFKHIVETVPEEKAAFNWYGSAINRILCVRENEILQEAISYCNSKQATIMALMFDGLMIEGDYYDNRQFLDGLEQHVENSFPGLGMKWTYKAHTTGHLEMPSDFVIPERASAEPDKTKTFTAVCSEFEKTHCKIVNRSVFVKQCADDIVVFSKPQLITSYEHMVYEEVDHNGILREKCFITKWLQHPAQRRYDDIGCYPNASRCPDNVLNSWVPFAMESVTEWTDCPDGLAAVRAHISILCGRDEEVTMYFEKWIGQMLKYPEQKSTCITFISKEGAGKGRLMELLARMLGRNRVMESTDPARDVWGAFNGQMANSFLVNLNEIGKKDMVDSIGKVKGLITDSKLYINSKGVNAYPMDSYHRFLITTNNSEPINTAADDRRNVIIRSSDEKIGDRHYFNCLSRHVEDLNTIKTCYEYFKSLPDLDKFRDLPLPRTEYQRDLQELSVSPIEQWVQSIAEGGAFIASATPSKVIQSSSGDMLQRFTRFCSDNNIQYTVNTRQLGKRLKNLNIPGVSFTKVGGGRGIAFDVPTLLAHYKDS